MRKRAKKEGRGRRAPGVRGGSANELNATVPRPERKWSEGVATMPLLSMQDARRRHLPVGSRVLVDFPQGGNAFVGTVTSTSGSTGSWTYSGTYDDGDSFEDVSNESLTQYPYYDDSG